MTVEQVDRHLGLACYTLRRWMDQGPFLEAWAKTNTLLHLRRSADDAVLGKPAMDVPEGAASRSPDVITTNRATDETDDQRRDDAAPPHARRDRPATAATAATAAAAPKSDRDLIRLRHGEEAARVFDDLLRRHVPPDVVPEPVPPASAPPPPDDGAMVVQPFQAAVAG